MLECTGGLMCSEYWAFEGLQVMCEEAKPDKVRMQSCQLLLVGREALNWLHMLVHHTSVCHTGVVYTSMKTLQLWFKVQSY